MNWQNPQQAERNFSLLRQLASLKEEHWTTFVCAHPGLFAPYVLEALLLRLKMVSGSEHAQLMRALAFLDYSRHYLEENPTSFLIGEGPIEKMWRRVVNGEIGEKVAKNLIRDPSVTAQLSLAYLRALSRVTIDLAQGQETDTALQLERLILAAIDEAGDSNEDYKLMRQQAYMDWLLVARGVLIYVPDGRILRNARDVGERMVDEMRTEGYQDELGRALYRLGSLHLDPYLNYGSAAAFQKHWQESWTERLHAQPVLQFGTMLDEVRMPPMDEALQLAEVYYRAAATVREGHHCGRTFKALAQTLYLRHQIGGPLDHKDLSAICKQALQFLDPTQDPQDRLTVLNILQEYKLDQLPDLPLDEVVQLHGPSKALELVNEAINLLSPTRPHWALDLLCRARSLVMHYGTEQTRSNYLQAELALIIWTLPIALPADLLQKDTKSAVERVRRRSKREQWDNVTTSVALIALARNSSEHDEEAIGLMLLQEGIQLEPHFWEEHAEALALLQADLTHGMGVNYAHGGDEVEGATQYAEALGQYLGLGLASHSLTCLRYISDMLDHGDPKVGLCVAAGLAPVALQLEKQLGVMAVRDVQYVYKRARAAMLAGPVFPKADLLVYQMAKGLVFATALATGARYDWKEDTIGQELLDRIVQAEVLTHGIDGDEAFHTQGELDEYLLSAYMDKDEMYGGETPQERLDNLQRQYDAHVQVQLITNGEVSEASYLMIEDLQSALDERTVLIDFYLGMDRDAQLTTYLLIITQDRVEVVVIPFVGVPDMAVWMSDERQSEQRVTLHLLALTTQALRENLVEDPGLGRRVSPEAAEDLEQSVHRYIGLQTMQYLEQLRAAGKDHLCFVPHGPMHYYPLHLLGPEDAPIAAQWIVTYLPNLGLLMPRKEKSSISRQQTLATIGLTFKEMNPFKLPCLPQSLSESTTIANLYGVSPIVDEAATKAAVCRALESARFVHLSTHGKHNITGPMFQCLYVFPDKESDGRLSAYEILSLNLHGLDLLTLSACETALGRFDLSDNLRGLPAAFLLAGVATVIGTLWEAEASASEQFFSVFYRELQASGSKLDAFAAAQRQTRKTYPAYRDWGPFYLIGGWR